MTHQSRNICFIILLLSYFLCGFSFFDDIKLGRYAQKKQIHEIVNMLQPKLDEGEQLSTWHLFFLGSSYYELRNYDKALAITDLMQKQIDHGDFSYMGSDLTVYPQVLRGSIYLDQGNIPGAIEEGSLAYKMLHEAGRDRKNFYTSQLISISDFLGVALAINGKKEETKRLSTLSKELIPAARLWGRKNTAHWRGYTWRSKIIIRR
jgi:tetratricopeptide (TPR) repeat protein